MSDNQPTADEAKRPKGPFSVFSTRFIDGLEHGIMTAIAGLLAYTPMHMLGVKEGVWGAITAVTVVQADFGKIPAFAKDQLVGAALGGGVAVIALVFFTLNTLTYAATLLLSIMACWLLNTPSSARVAAITATILILIPGLGSPEWSFVSRISEVCWGIIVAAVVLWVAEHLRDHN